MWKAFDDRQSMTATLADEIADALRAAVETRGEASLVVSGGGTPKQLFNVLSKRILPWDKVTITLADERWTDAGDANEHLVRRHLLVDEAAAARFVPLKNAAGTPEAGRAECERVLAGVPSPFDVVILGMGGDGHTASLFPHAETLPEALAMDGGRACLALTPPELPAHAPYPRMTLSLPRLLNSRWIVLLLAGEDKRAVYERARAGDDVNAMPVRAVLQQSRTPVETWWAP